MDLALIFQALFPFLAECQDEGKVKEDENTLHQKMTRQLDALFSKPHFPLDLQIMAHDLFQKLFIQQEVLPLDDLLFYVLQGKPSKRDSIFVKRKRPNVEGVDVRRDDPPLPSANDPDGHPMNWFATLALNIISQSNYLLKVTVTRCSSNHPPPEPTPHHPPLTTIWQGQAFASPNKSYFGDHQNISTEDSSSEKNAAEIRFLLVLPLLALSFLYLYRLVTP